MRYAVILLSGFLINASNSQKKQFLNNDLHSGLTEKIGNFSIELLYHTTNAQEVGDNLIISPITVWTILAVIAEGATENTAKQLNTALRISPKFRDKIRSEFQEIEKWLQVNTSTIELQKLNALFIQEDSSPLRDFLDTAKTQYETRLIPVDFSKPDLTMNLINNLVSSVTRGRIPQLVDINDINNSNLILTSAMYFKGQWTVPFNSSQTSKEPFYDSNGKKVGEVNMMYNRHTYPFANISPLQAKVIEIPYGKHNRLSMLIMLPNTGVSLNEMFYNFGNVTLDTVFSELQLAVEEYGEDEVDCFIPRFKIQSSLELTTALKAMGIRDMFDDRKARLQNISRKPVHVSRVIHKAEIEVTEEGTVASAATAAEFTNRISVISFVANRPFCYLIIEKVTNSIAFGGFYQTPSLF